VAHCHVCVAAYTMTVAMAMTVTIDVTVTINLIVTAVIRGQALRVDVLNSTLLTITCEVSAVKSHSHAHTHLVFNHFKITITLTH
jgi:hypothetical protein